MKMSLPKSSKMLYASCTIDALPIPSLRIPVQSLDWRQITYLAFNSSWSRAFAKYNHPDCAVCFERSIFQGIGC